MKLALSFLALLSVSQAFAKIVHQDDKFYVKTKDGLEEMLSLNTMIANKEVSIVKLYDNGNVHMVTFSKGSDPEQNYSVDEKGFIYSLAPFSTYKVQKINNQGYIHFAEVPNHRYYVTSKGFFIYK